MVIDLECDHQLSRIVRLAPPPVDPPHPPSPSAPIMRPRSSECRSTARRVCGQPRCVRIVYDTCGPYPAREAAGKPRLGHRCAETSARRTAELCRCIMPIA